MLNIRTILILLFSALFYTTVYAETSADTQQQLSKIRSLKLQLFDDLNSGPITSSEFDEKTEMQIANTQMEIAQYYLSQGDKKSAAINAIVARKILQRLYGNYNNPRLIPVYSLLVQIYASKVDIDRPNVDASDADKARMYREMIDHIHAE